MTGDLKASGRLTERDGEPVLEAKVSSRRLGVDDAELLDTTLGSMPRRIPGSGTQIDARRSAISNSPPKGPGRSRRTDRLGRGADRFFAASEGQGEQREIHLVESAALRVTRDSLSLSRACLRGSIEARLCLELNWVANARLEVLADLDSIAVDRVNQFFDTGFAFDQLVTGQMHWDKRRTGRGGVRAALDLARLDPECRS